MPDEPETFSLKVERCSSSSAIEVCHHRIDGDAAFIAEEVAVLLSDPLLVSFQLIRAAKAMSSIRQVSE